MKTRFVSLLLALALCISLVGTVAVAETETVKVGVMMPMFGGNPVGTPVHTEWEKSMSEKLGVNFEFEFTCIPWGEYTEKNNIALASADFPDLFYLADESLGVPYFDQEIFVELSEYTELMPNYVGIVESTRNGWDGVLDADGHFYGFNNAEIPRLLQGLGIYSVSSYRYDIFQENNIAIPTTLDEFHQAALALKEIYPDIYPVKGDMAMPMGAYHTTNKIFWNGEAFEYGPINEGYKKSLEYMAALYAENLIDPESFTMNTDDWNRKCLNGSLLMNMSNWFNYASTKWNINTEFTGKWVNTERPDVSADDIAWQSVSNVNEVALGGHFLVINIDAENRELLIKLADEQYTEDTTRLITWGIEGTTYEIIDGLPEFVESIKTAENAWAEGDKYGMRASNSYRPGLQLCIDTRAFINFAPADPCYINGEQIDTPWETAFPNYEWPTSEKIPTDMFKPAISFTTDESNDNSTVMTAVETYVTETTQKFIKGDLVIADEWDNYVATITGMGIEDVLEMYNAKAAALAE